jgi:hypothetical protein
MIIITGIWIKILSLRCVVNSFFDNDSQSLVYIKNKESRM